MNREEIIIQIQDKLNKAYMLKDREEADRIIKSIFDDVDKLRQPITLAEFLGWEEDVDYEYNCINCIYKIKNNTLYKFNHIKNEFEVSNLSLYSRNIKILRQAKKIEKKYFLVLKKEIREVLNLTDNCMYYMNLDEYLLGVKRCAKKVTKKEFEEIKKIVDIFELEEV